MKKITSFTTILHDKRKRLGLSLMEYCIADTVYNLSNNPKSPVHGWCYASKEALADILGTTRQTIFTCVNNLIEKGLVEKHEETRYLRTSESWYNNIIITTCVDEKKELTPKEEMSKFLIDENFKKEIIEKISKNKKLSLEFVQEEVDAFIEYWTTKSANGKNIRWEKQQYFELGKRLGTWFKNKKEWNNDFKKKKTPDVMCAREDGTQFIRLFGRWCPKDNPKNIVDLNYYKSVANEDLITVEEYEQSIRK